MHYHHVSIDKSCIITTFIFDVWILLWFCFQTYKITEQIGWYLDWLNYKLYTVSILTTNFCFQKKTIA